MDPCQCVDKCTFEYKYFLKTSTWTQIKIGLNSFHLYWSRPVVFDSSNGAVYFVHHWWILMEFGDPLTFLFSSQHLLDGLAQFWFQTFVVLRRCGLLILVILWPITSWVTFLVFREMSQSWFAVQTFMFPSRWISITSVVQYYMLCVLC